MAFRRIEPGEHGFDHWLIQVCVVEDTDDTGQEYLTPIHIADDMYESAEYAQDPEVIGWVLGDIRTNWPHLLPEDESRLRYRVLGMNVVSEGRPDEPPIIRERAR